MPIHDFLNLDFCVARADDVAPAGGVVLGGGTTGVDVPEFGAVVEALPGAGVAEDELEAVTESTESERDVLERFGNIEGMRNPGERGFTA